MSDITTQIRFETKISKAIDPKSTRYALHAVEVIPADEGNVYATATDSRQLSVVKCEGSTDRRILVPGEVLPTRKPTARKPFTVSRNGRWETSDGKFSDSEVEGRFPKVCDVIPEVDTETHVAVSLDVRILAKVADAMGSDALTLLVKLPTEERCHSKESRHSVNEAVCVLPCERDEPADGFGVIMPLTGTDSDFATFNAKRAEYAAAHSAMRSVEREQK